MSIILRVLPIILISIIFYLLIYNLYPKYQELISLAKKFNELQNKEKEISDLEKLIQATEQNPNIQQLINNKEVLNIWLPQEPKTENILAFLNGIYQLNNFIFRGMDFRVTGESRVYNQNVLPVKIISYDLNVNLNNNNLMSFIDEIEKNARLTTIKKADIASNGASSFAVESYYLSDK